MTSREKVFTDITMAPQADGAGLERLSREECVARLKAHRTGRLILGQRVPPMVVPVSFSVEDRGVVARVPAAAVAGIHWPALVTLEADDLDPAAAEGWSVTVLGGCELASDEGGFPTVTVEADLVTGRRFRVAQPRRTSCS